MGGNLGFIAFDHQPDLTIVRGLRDWRIFERRGRSEWYVDGPPDKRHAGAIFFAPPTIRKEAFGNEWRKAIQEYNSLIGQLRGLGRDSFGLDYKLVPLALAISAVLQTRLLVASGNDEDLDCAFICSRGRLFHGRFLVGESEAMIFDAERGSRIEKIIWQDSGRLYHELTGIVAAEYFNNPDPQTYANSYGELVKEEYVLIKDSTATTTERTNNQLLGCAVIGVCLAALPALLSLYPPITLPLGISLVFLAIVWRFWPARSWIPGRASRVRTDK